MSAKKLALLFLVLAGLGCGSRGSVAGDGGTDAKVTGRLSFDVVATLAVGDGGFNAGGGLPATNAFTLTLDADAQQAVVGGKGHGATVAATTTDGRTFHIGAFSTGVKSGSVCEGASSIDYKSLDVTISGTTLRGQASGSAEISCGDCFFNVLFTADVTGGPDVTRPSLSLSGGAATGPFAHPFFIASEPLLPTAKAKISGTGVSVDLVPLTNPDDPSVVLGFSEPNVLPGSVGFTVAFDGLTDFGGHMGSADVPLRLDGFSVPPLIAEDGFESVTAAQVDGAAVIGASAPVAPIAGKQSLYIGGTNAPAIPGVKFGQSLNVRLGVQPGDTRVRFSYRTIASLTGAVVANVDVGSVGRAPAATQTIVAQVGVPTTTWVDGQVVTVSDIATREIMLPPDVTGEVTVSIGPASFSCGGPMPTPPVVGLQMDDFVVD